MIPRYTPKDFAELWSPLRRYHVWLDVELAACAAMEDANLVPKGTAARICHGDTVMDKSLPVLDYGELWQRGGFTCKSEQTGITCFNADRRGFSLARAKQEVF